jgi:CHAT domain-containing protein
LRGTGAGNRSGGPRLVAVANPCAYTIDKDSPSAHPADAASSEIHRAGVSGCTIVGAPLNGARREVDALAQQVDRYGFRRAEIYDWGMAQEELFDSCVVGADVVHIATHGYRIARDCLPVAPRDPLVLSGVVLAGASRMVPDGMRGGNEGFLSAAEVAGLNLSAARLVFWSACATASGDPLPNESVSGLSAAGWLAGAEATVATLWLVSDETTPRQVEAFYQRWLAGKSPARALQEAHIGGLEDAREAGESTHPVLWAAWVVDGL